MKRFLKTIVDILHEHKVLLVLMFILFVMGLAFFVFSLFCLHPNTPVANIGYSDIDGYRSGPWGNLLAFPLLAILFGILHNFLAMRIYQKRGAGLAQVFVVISIFLLIGAFIVLLRLIGVA